MNVNYCSTVYNDTYCSTAYPIINNYLNNVYIGSRIITQVFDPNYYAENSNMDYVELSRSRTNIIGDFGLVKGYSIEKTKVNFYSGKFIDVSNISIFNPSKELYYYKAIQKANDFLSTNDIYNRTMGLVQIQYT